MAKKKTAPSTTSAPQLMTAAAPSALPAGLLPTTGPGGGAMSAITPLSFSSAGYPGAESFLLGSSMPKGQTFSSSQFKGDTLNTGEFLVGENTPVQIRDQDGNVLYSGVGYAGAQEAADLTKQLVGNKDITSFSVEGYDPYTGQWQGLGGSARPTDLTGEFASLVVPAALGIALPGIGGALGASLTGALGSAGTAALGSALGSAAVGAARGQGIGDILKNAAIAGAGAYGGASLGSALGGNPSSALSSTTGAGAGSAAGSAAGATGNIIEVVRNAGSALAGLGSSLGAAAPGVINAMQPQATTPSNDQIVVTGNRALTPFEEAFASLLPAVPPAATSGTPLNPNDVIEVTANPEPEPFVPQMVGPDLESVLGPVAPVAGGLVGNVLPSEPKAAPTTGSLLRDIITYGNLAAGGVDMLSGLLAGAGGGAGTMTPYVSQLGPAPSFSRGEFRPYTGDYETYGFGPEFSFFAPTQPGLLPSAPNSAMVNPLLPVNNTVLA